MRAACSASPVICVRRKRRTDRGAHACGRCALRQADDPLLSWGSRLLSWGGAFLRPARAFGAPRSALPRTVGVLGCGRCARGGARCAFACGGFAFRQAGCSLLPSGDARCALRSALPRTACALGGARSGGLGRGPLCRPGEAQCADGRPTVAPREPTLRQGEIARCQRRDDARCLVPPSACAPRLPSTLPPCRAVCGCATGVAEGPPLLFPMCAAGWADRTFALPPCRAVCGCAAGASGSTPSTFAPCAAGWPDRAFALPPCRAVCGCAAGASGSTPSTFATDAAGVLVFHSLRQFFFRCLH